MLKACSLALLALSGPFLVPVMAADAPQEQAPATTAAPASNGAVATTMMKKGNVRFGPSVQAKSVTTLDAGAPVEVLGVAQGMPEWYVIRFPREGSAWIHEKVIHADASGKKAKVVEDRARVRDDARQGGNIVAELALGEEVELKERARVGAWVPIYPPSAVAYVHKSVLNVPVGAAPAPGGKAADPLTPITEHNERLDDLWAEVQARYNAYKTALDRDVEVAAKLDWEFLDGELAQVVDGHPSVRVQLAAKRLKDRIAPVVSAAVQVQRANHIAPLRDVPGEPPISVSKTPKVLVPAPANSEPVQPPKGVDQLPPAAKPDPAQPPNGIVPLPKPIDTKELKEAGQKAPAPAAVGEFAAQGFLEERAVAAVGTNYVLIDKNGKVCAFVKAKPGIDLQLSEFFWRLVGVKGESQPIEADKHGQGGGAIPLVLVDDVMLLH